VLKTDERKGEYVHSGKRRLTAFLGKKSFWEGRGVKRTRKRTAGWEKNSLRLIISSRYEKNEENSRGKSTQAGWCLRVLKKRKGDIDGGSGMTRVRNEY